MRGGEHLLRVHDVFEYVGKRDDVKVALGKIGFLEEARDDLEAPPFAGEARHFFRGLHAQELPPLATGVTQERTHVGADVEPVAGGLERLHQRDITEVIPVPVVGCSPVQDHAKLFPIDVDVTGIDYG